MNTTCECYIVYAFLNERRRCRGLGKYRTPRQDRMKRSGEEIERDEPSSGVADYMEDDNRLISEIHFGGC